MLRSTVIVDPAFRVAPVRRRTFGSFVEHLGRCVYTGIHDPSHPTADGDGFRGDVVELVRELGVSTVRYARHGDDGEPLRDRRRMAGQPSPARRRSCGVRVRA